MAAYAALVSLMNTIYNIHNHSRLSTSLDKEQIESLGEKLDFLLDFLEGNEEAQVLESQIASVAHAAEDVIETHIVDRIGHTFEREETSSSSMQKKVIVMNKKKVLEDMDSLKEKVTKIKVERGFKDLPPTYSTVAASSSYLTTGKTSVVGFKSYVLQLLNWLTAQQSHQQIIPITGMGGIGGDYVGVVAPSEIWEMQQLRHLKFNQVHLRRPSLSDDEQDQIVLRNLQTLQVAWIICGDEVCKRMPNIRKLSILLCDNLWGEEDTLPYFCFHHVCRLTKLESLHFDSRHVPMCFSLNLSLPSSLKKLALQNCLLKWDDLTRIGSLPHLEVLKLDVDSVQGPEWNPIEGEFLRLKYLLISKCSSLIQWNADNSHFPVLQKLVIVDLWKLDEIPSGIGDILTLGHIYLVGSSVSAAISAAILLKEQESLGNEDLRVRVKFSNDKRRREEVRAKVELEGFASHNFQLY